MNKLFSILLFTAFFAVILSLKHDLKVTMDNEEFEKQIANISVTLRHSNRFHEFTWETILTPNSNHSNSVDYVYRFNQVREVLFKWKSRELPTNVNSSYVYLKYIFVTPAYYANPDDRKKYTRLFCLRESSSKVTHDSQVTLYPCPWLG